MPPITALLHTSNDARRLGRALETLLPCAEVIVVDRRSTDTTSQVAARYGSRLIPASECGPVEYLDLALHDWILCLDPWESMTEGLQATIFEWSLLPNRSILSSQSFRIAVRRQVGGLWHTRPTLETRLVHRSWTCWTGNLPENDESSVVLEGELLHLDLP